MADKNPNLIDQRMQDLNNDGVDRRGFLKCMAWAGTGLVWTFSGGIPVSTAFAKNIDRLSNQAGDFSFVQISDSHMGFNKPANQDVIATLQAAVDKINGLAKPPEFLLHTGDISHLSKPEQFDNVDQILKSASAKEVFFVPGEHDVLDDNGKQYLERYGKSTQGNGWYSFDKHGVHFIGLVNVMNLKAGGLGSLGGEQLEWMEKEVKHLKHSTPIVVFAHIPLWTVYPDWGWGTEDSAQALALPEEIRFGDGAERAHSPDHAEGRRQSDISYRDVDGISATAAGQGRFSRTDESAGGTVAHPAGNYRCQLCAGAALTGVGGFRPGVGHVRQARKDQAREDLSMTKSNAWFGSLAIPAMIAVLLLLAGSISVTANADQPAVSAAEVKIDNFSFTPQTLTVPAGATVTWTNRDDIPHSVVSTDGVFKSAVRDTDEKFSYTFAKAGTYSYYCSIHPKMTGKVVVQ